MVLFVMQKVLEKATDLPNFEGHPKNPAIVKLSSNN
jgi:hypothetical protein